MLYQQVLGKQRELEWTWGMAQKSLWLEVRLGIEEKVCSGTQGGARLVRWGGPVDTTRVVFIINSKLKLGVGWLEAGEGGEERKGVWTEWEGKLSKGCWLSGSVRGAQRVGRTG